MLRSQKRPAIRGPDKTRKVIKLQLEAAGVEVWEIGQPCGLLLRFWCQRHHDYCWQPLDLKLPRGKKTPLDKRLKGQLLLSAGMIAAATFESAWLALNRLHTLDSVRLQTHVRTLEITT